MKVCIPTEGEGGIDDLVGQHFGRVPTYTIVDLDTNEVEVTQNTSEHMGGVGSGTVRDAIEEWQQGQLMEATDENACQEHRH